MWKRERGTRSRFPFLPQRAASTQLAHVGTTTIREDTERDQDQVRVAPCLVRQVCADVPSSQRSPSHCNEHRLSRSVRGCNSSVSSRLTHGAVCSCVRPLLFHSSSPLPARWDGCTTINPHSALLTASTLQTHLSFLSTRASASLGCGLSSPRLFSPTPTPLALFFFRPIFQRLLLLLQSSNTRTSTRL
jgi:hypothetical protein